MGEEILRATVSFHLAWQSSQLAAGVKLIQRVRLSLKERIHMMSIRLIPTYLS